MSNSSISQIVLHLLSKKGPQTSKQLLLHINEYPEMKSHSYLKSKVLNNMKSKELIYKKVYRGDPNDLKSSKIKPIWLWYLNENKVNKDAHMELYPKEEKDNEDNEIINV